MNEKISKILLIANKPEELEHFMFPLKNHFHIQVAQSLESGTFLIKEWEPDLIVFRLNQDLPALNSFLRHHSHSVGPGLIVVGESTLNNEEVAFMNGADHFVGLMYEGKSLLIRSQALSQKIRQLRSWLKTSHPTSPDVEKIIYQFEGIEIFPKDHIAKRGQQLLTLTPIQFRLLKMFVTSQEQLLSRNAIKQIVWQDSEISPRSIDAQISKLRKIVPELDHFLFNIYGKGYILTKSKVNAA